MFLKRLEIKGFKSFSANTVLDFLPSQNGRHSITAIVGPNGSGKSNISDAVRWVMGEQSLKALRGKKSEDIIFGGSQTKGQLSAAEVEMTLDNGDGRVLPDHPEITLTRRLYRSGEGEYLINNNAVRLLDVYLLLAKLQFAQHSYSVIGQGTIDRLLMVSPAERKDFLDEASGIKEFKIKQHQAELKLSRARDNVNSARTLMQEVEPRLRILSRQVKKLQKRQEVETELRESQEIYYGSIYLANQLELDKIKSELAKTEADYRRSFVQLQSIQEELAAAAKESSRQQVFDDLQDKHQKLVDQKHELERLLAVKNGQMQAEYGQQGKQGVAWLEKKVSELNSKKEELALKIKNTRLELDRSAADVFVKKELLDKLTRQKIDAQMEISRLQKQMLDCQTEQNLRQHIGLLAAAAVLENHDKFGRIYGLLAELGTVDEKYRLALEVAVGSYLSAIVVEDEEVARKAIEFLRQNRFGYATFFPLNKMSQIINPALPPEIVSFCGVYGRAIDLIDHDERFCNVFSFVLRATLVVEDLSIANQLGLSNWRVVTLLGDVVEKSGVIKGGYRQARRGGLGFSQKLLFGSQGLSQIQQELEKQRAQLAAIEKEIETVRADLAYEQAKQSSLSDNVEALYAEQDLLCQEIASLKQDLELTGISQDEFGSMLKKMSVEKDELTNKIKVKAEEVLFVAEQIATFNQEEEDKKKRVFSLQDQMQDLQTVVNQVLTERNEWRVQLARLETKQEGIMQEARDAVGSPIESIVSHTSPAIKSQAELQQLGDKVQKLRYQLSLIGGIDQEVIAEHEQTKSKYDFLFGQITDLEVAIDDLEKMSIELEEVMRVKRAAAFKKIRKEFIRYIQILFGGGSADMEEIYGEQEADKEEDTAVIVSNAVSGVTEDVLSHEPIKKKENSKKIVTGIDIVVNPPGKKIKNINTLSGGERTLASIALICAVLNYNPSPFVVLDEVEAALDETNTRRFSQIVIELARYSQFIIITHNRVTMHAADALYGVTMGTDGMSKLLSVKLQEVQTVA